MARPPAYIHVKLEGQGTIRGLVTVDLRGTGIDVYRSLTIWISNGWPVAFRQRGHMWYREGDRLNGSDPEHMKLLRENFGALKSTNLLSDEFMEALGHALLNDYELLRIKAKDAFATLKEGNDI
jgi:hypothetical protein